MANNPIHCPSSATTNRKLIERNRRNEMKALFSTLHSLVSNQSSMEAKALPDQLESATNYIKELEGKVKKLKEKREKLMGMAEQTTITRSEETKPRLLLQVEAHQVGSSVEILFTTGSNYHFVLRQILQLLQENGAEIVNIHQSMSGDRVFHKITAQLDGEAMAFGSGRDGEAICEMVKKFASQYKDGSIHCLIFCPKTFPGHEHL